MNKEELNLISSESESEEGDKFTTPPRTPFIESEDPINSNLTESKQEVVEEELKDSNEIKTINSTLINKQLSSSNSNSNDNNNNNNKPNLISIMKRTETDLIEKLKNQILDLSSQVTSLNSKLVDGYTRLGDLEDELHERNQKELKLNSKLIELEKEKLERDKAIETGGWVERVS